MFIFQQKRIITVRTLTLTIVCVGFLVYLISFSGDYELVTAPSSPYSRNLYFQIKNCIKQENNSQEDRHRIKKHFVQVKDQRIYLYSAIIHRTVFKEYSKIGKLQSKSKNTDFIALNGWKHIHVSANSRINCCYLHEDFTATFAEPLGNEKVHFHRSMLKDVQYRCPLLPKRITGVALNRKSSPCPTEEKYYISPTVVSKQESLTVGICTKISYGSLKAGPLVEWFEAMRFLGVDKIISYHANLSRETEKIFEYYSSIGLVDSYPFRIPVKDAYQRELGEKSKQAWTDEQVVINDCQLRLHAFKYAIYLDKDEILLPKNLTMKNSLKTYFEGLDKDIAGLYFLSEIHLTDWEPWNCTHPLFIGKYTVSSVPVKNTVKYMLKPPLFKTAGCYAHYCYMLNGSQPIFAKENEITVHHFRSCDTKRKYFVNGTFCRNTTRSSSAAIAQLADALIKPVSDTLDILDLS